MVNHTAICTINNVYFIVVLTVDMINGWSNVYETNESGNIYETNESGNVAEGGANNVIKIMCKYEYNQITIP